MDWNSWGWHMNSNEPKRSARIRRRELLRIGTATFAGWSLSPLNESAATFARAATQSGRSKKHPNILLIITDQQHAGMMSCTGNRYLRTPAMDRMASLGVRFELAYAKGCHWVGTDRSRFDQAISLAEASDVTVVVVGDTSMLIGGGVAGADRALGQLAAVLLELLVREDVEMGHAILSG